MAKKKVTKTPLRKGIVFLAIEIEKSDIIESVDPSDFINEVLPAYCKKKYGEGLFKVLGCKMTNFIS